MKRTLLIATMILFLLAGAANAFTVCVWRDCPQPNEHKLKATTEPAPDVQIVPNINLNGDTFLVFGPRADLGSHVGVGASTTVLKFRDIVDLDVAWVKIPDAPVDSLYAMAIPISLSGIAKLFGAQINLPNILTLKIGPAGFFDPTHGFKPYGGIKATFIQANF